MLVAKRDPYDFGAHDRPAPHLATAPTSSRFTRTLNILQMVGALIAVPAGVGSAYTMYKANFSPEASCKSLRANIVAVLDRSVDASTRHMLVRRDVEAFEQTCGTVDPDATAAFRVLLKADNKAEPVVASPAPRAEPQPQAAVRKSEAAPAVKPKQSVARTAEPAARPNAAESDAAWVAAVRTALVRHEPEPDAAPAAVAPPTPIVVPHLFSEWRTSPLPAPPQAAPALPPPATVATVAAPQADPDHPVPPAAVPETQSPVRAHSRLGKLVGEIPFFGRTLADRVSR